MDDNQLMAELANFEVNHSSGLSSSEFNPSSENSVTIQTKDGEMWSLPLKCNSEEDANILSDFNEEVLCGNLLSQSQINKLSTAYFDNGTYDEEDIYYKLEAMYEDYWDNLENTEEDEGFETDGDNDFTDEELEEFAELENKLRNKEETSLNLQKVERVNQAFIPTTITEVSVKNMLAIGLIK